MPQQQQELLNPELLKKIDPLLFDFIAF